MKIRRRVFALLERPPRGNRAAAFIQHTIIVLIIVSVAALVVETVQPLGTDYRAWFLWIEWITVAVFTVEIVLRVWAAGEHPHYIGLRGRIRYMFRPLPLLDILAVLPFYLTFATVDLRYLRVFRVMRVLRLAKLARYSAAMRALGRVVVSRRFELGVALALGFLLLLIASALMYFVEHETQPEAFKSIPATMWWAIATLTTVGYGDLAPITSVGRMLGGVIAVIGIGMFALPTAILGAAFVDELKQISARKAGNGACPTCGRSHGPE
ncbi:MAG: ion transporter [Xanthomonadaceae bacterium]|nr:ion transporter [Xanthomonadaceae bacterium]